jgi:sugar lactone lactonase YvrE
MRRFSIFIVPFLCAVFVFIFLVGTIFSARADYSTANFQGVAEEATETETEEPSPTASPTSTVEQLSSSTPTNTETESTPTVTSSPTSTPEPSLTPSPLPIDTLTPTPTAPQLPQNLSTTQRSFFHYPYSRPPAGFRPKTGDSTRPPLQAVASSWGNTDMDTNGKLNQPYDVDTDAYGNVYVADAQNRRIKVYNPNGTLIRQWGEWGWEEGNFEHPVLISLDKLNDYVYVFDDWRNQLSKFNLTGDFIDRWDIDGDWVTALAISPSDQNPYIAVHKNDGFRIQILNKNDGGIIDEFGPMIDGFTFEAISDIAIDTNGNIYISDESVGIIIKYNQTFEYQGLLGDSNNTCWWEENTFCGTIFLAIDGSNNIYAIDYTHRVQKFDSSLNYQSEFGSHGSGNGQLNFARGITVSNSGYIYVTDTFNHRIQKFTSSGTYLTQWGSNLTPNGLLNNPQGIAVNSNGVYIADTYNHRVQKFSHTGVFQAKWGSQGYGSYGNNPFLYTRVPDVAFDSANNIYLIDQWANRIIKTNPNGSLIRYYGEKTGIVTVTVSFNSVSLGA